MAIFVENYKKVDKSKFVNFFEFTLYMIFKNFQEFSGKSQKSYIGWIRKNPGLHSCHHFCVSSSNIANFGKKNLKFLSIGPIKIFDFYSKT